MFKSFRTTVAVVDWNVVVIVKNIKSICKCGKKCDSEKEAIYETLRIGVVGGPAEVFTKCYERDIIHIRSHLYRAGKKLAKNFIGYDANSFYLFCSIDVISRGKERLTVNEKSLYRKSFAKFTKNVLKGQVLRFV